MVSNMLAPHRRGDDCDRDEWTVRRRSVYPLAPTMFDSCLIASLIFIFVLEPEKRGESFLSFVNSSRPRDAAEAGSVDRI